MFDIKQWLLSVGVSCDTPVPAKYAHLHITLKLPVFKSNIVAH